MYLMNKVYMEYFYKFVVVFINDILIYAKTEVEHEEHLRLVLEKLIINQLYAKFNKHEFWLTQDAFLGHVISAGGVLVDPGKVRDVLNWKPPMNVLEIHRFLGLAGYYLRFIQDFSKKCLRTVQVLVLPHLSKKFDIYCDSSRQDLGCLQM
jgi:hypothetical protein